MKTSNCLSLFFSIFLFTAILFISNITIAQAVIKGKIIYKNDAAPAAFVNIELQGKKGPKAMSDNAGYFRLEITEAQRQDSIVISSVGYKSIRMPVSAALTKSVFVLSEIIKNMEGVTVFNSHEVIGSMSETVGYYRSWNPKKSGEIGRIFHLPYEKFKIDKIRFKASNTCDTCLLRLHIRSVEENGEPGDEIFEDSISVLVNHLSLDSKVSEFDLTPYDFTFTENEFFVGIELIQCGNGKKGSCAFNFAGTEKGEYIFKSTAASPWLSTDDYTIYLKLFLRF
jgi:hypothetical protein